jgi:hypothetical protein
MISVAGFTTERFVMAAHVAGSGFHVRSFSFPAQA